MNIFDNDDSSLPVHICERNFFVGRIMNGEEEPLRLGLEATGHYWMALHSHLMACGYEIYHPQSAHSS